MCTKNASSRVACEPPSAPRSPWRADATVHRGIGVLIATSVHGKALGVLDLVQAASADLHHRHLHQLLPYLFFVRTKGEWLGRVGASGARAHLICSARP